MKKLFRNKIKQLLSLDEKKPVKNLLEMVNAGENVRLMGENILDRVNPQLIFIGNHCVIGFRSSILTHCPIRGGVKAILGDFVWLGFGVYVLPGAKIGNNTIVGAGSIVTKEFPDNVILAGNPARIIRGLEDDEIEMLRYRLRNKLPMGKMYNE